MVCWLVSGILRVPVMLLVFCCVMAVAVLAEGQAHATDSGDVATKVICNVIGFVQKLGLPIMTGVIPGSSIMAIFGKLGWPAIVMLVVFTAIFFGASKLINKFVAGINSVDTTSFECTSSSTA